MIGKFAEAFAKAQSSFVQVIKDNKVNAGSMKYKYADLAAIISASRTMNQFGLCFVQGSRRKENSLVVTTRIMHSSGQWIESDCEMPITQKGPHAVGSAFTYAKRYGLSALLGIAAEEDDDGHAAQGITGSRITSDQTGIMRKLVKEVGGTWDDFCAHVAKQSGGKSPEHLSAEEAGTFIASMRAKIDKKSDTQRTTEKIKNKR